MINQPSHALSGLLPVGWTRFARAIAAAAVILAISACQSTPSSTAPAKDSHQDTSSGVPSSDRLLVRAAGLVRLGDARAAAELFLQAAARMIEQGRMELVPDVLNRVDVHSLSDDDAAHYTLLQLQLALSEHRIQDARAFADTLSTTPWAEPGEHFWPLLAALCEAERDHACVANAWLRSDVPDGQRQQAHDNAWHAMGQVPRSTLIRLAGAGDARAAWQLRLALGTAFSTEEQRARWQSWSVAWPSHGFAAMPPSSVRVMLESAWQPPVIAVMAPFSGRLAPAGRAVRNGFASALISDSAELKPQVLFYDTQTHTISEAYELALAAGAQVLVGPLQKSNLELLAGLDPDVPVVGLNVLKTPLRGIVQIGLAIEDEAWALVDRLLADGHRTLLVVHTQDAWSRRAVGMLLAQWPHEIVRAGLADLKTTTESIGVAMRIEASRARRDELAALLDEEIDFLPRARTDLDAVTAFIGEAEAAAMVPALKFHFADHLPVYATSQAIRSAGRRLRDYEGFRVIEAPFTLYPDAMYREANRAFSLNDSRFAGLFALGVDAYRLANNAQLIQAAATEGYAINGSTGTLISDGLGRFRRTLDWAVVSNAALIPAAGSH